MRVEEAGRVPVAGHGAMIVVDRVMVVRGIAGRAVGDTGLAKAASLVDWERTEDGAGVTSEEGEASGTEEVAGIGEDSEGVNGAAVEDPTSLGEANGTEEATGVDVATGALGGLRVTVLGTAVTMAGF